MCDSSDMAMTPVRRCLGGCALLAALAGLPAPALAQALTRAQVQQRSTQVDQLFNWYYASVFGTGFYRIGEEQVGVASVPLSLEMRPATRDQWGWRLTLPVSVAVAQFDLRDFDLGEVRAQGVSVMPGVEADIPLENEWSLRPFANFGAGREFEFSSSSTLYSVGASAVRMRASPSESRMSLGARIAYAGYWTQSHRSNLIQFSLGGEWTTPLHFVIAERPALLAISLVGTSYQAQELDMELPASGSLKVSRELEVGVSFAVTRPFKILGGSFDHLGLAYREGDNGLRGVRLVTSFPF
ncbi:MAG: hypothetical protein ACREVQ_09425 [Burkholderiales bacterium]